MKKKRLSYHYVGLQATMVYRIIVAVVFLAILANIINLGAFYKGSAADLNTALLQSESGLSKVFNKINLPMKIVSDLFKSQKVNNDTKSNDAAGNNKYAIIVEPLSRFAAEINKKDAYFPITELRSHAVAVIDTGPKVLLLNSSYCCSFIMTLLLILLLMSLLPRGIPSKNKKEIKKYIFTRPVFI